MTTKVRQRRKEARPAEIIEAALECFLEKGFEPTKIEAVARRLGVAKGTIYLYFETKEQLFRAVVKQVTASNLTVMATAASAFEGTVEELVPVLLDNMVDIVATSRAPAVARLILTEVGRIPDLADIWLEEVVKPVIGALQAIMQRGQDRGEIRPGDARHQVISMLGPVMVGIIFGDFLGRLGLEPIDLKALARQHGQIVLHGLLKRPETPSP
jgi:AcrR family transcriptional regulator